jgi:7-carboxy-7-deazaguanine synthase
MTMNKTTEEPQWQSVQKQGDGKTLPVNEIAYTVEGEAGNVGYPYTFLRFPGCNLKCDFCDTDHKFARERTIEEIVEEVMRHPADWVCLTGGEPLLQNLAPLCQILWDEGYHLHAETNGTIPPDPRLFDLIEYWTVSPKKERIAPGFLRIDELKYIVGKTFREEDVEEDRARQVFLQPESSDPVNVWRAMDILRRHPTWRLSLRVHTLINLP